VSEVGECDNCGCRKLLALLKYDCGHGRAGYCWACLVGAAISIRETGASIPDGGGGPPTGAISNIAPEPPPLNKRGGAK
jgi:hypothetical protein